MHADDLVDQTSGQLSQPFDVADWQGWSREEEDPYQNKPAHSHAFLEHHHPIPLGEMKIIQRGGVYEHTPVPDCGDVVRHNSEWRL
jgi:hypothetical protein